MKNYSDDDNAFDDYDTYLIVIMKSRTGYDCEFIVKHYNGVEFYGNKSQITKFLKHILYNNLVQSAQKFLFDRHEN